MIKTQAQRALDYLAGDNWLFRLRTIWTMAFAHLLEGDRPAARRAYAELEAGALALGVGVYVPLAKLGLGDCLVFENELPAAAEAYGQGLRAFGPHPQPIASEFHHGLGRIQYEWNNLDAAEEHAEHARELASRYSSGIDRFILPEILLARIALARGQPAAAAARLDALAATARAPSFRHRLPQIAAAQVRVLLRQGRVEAAASLAAGHELPACRARVLLAQERSEEALAALEPAEERARAKGLKAELLALTVLRAVACRAAGRNEDALEALRAAMLTAEAGRFIRLFLDEGRWMADLLRVAQAYAPGQTYVHTLLAAFAAEAGATPPTPPVPGSAATTLVETLSLREREVLGLLAEGLSNQEMADRLFIALDTVKGHNRRIFEKLGVGRRTEAIARGRELGLL